MVSRCRGVIRAPRTVVARANGSSQLAALELCALLLSSKDSAGRAGCLQATRASDGSLLGSARRDPSSSRSRFPFPVPPDVQIS